MKTILPLVSMSLFVIAMTTFLVAGFWFALNPTPGRAVLCLGGTLLPFFALENFRRRS